MEMHGEIQRQWDKMKDIEKGRFLLNTPTSEREREYCICRKRFTKDDPSSPMVACNICDEWSHVEYIRFSYTFVHALPFFVYPIVLIQHSQAFYRYIRHHAWEVINYEIKDISFTCKDFSKLNVLMRKVIRLHKYPSQWKEMSILFTAPSLDILIHRGITNWHFSCYINAPIQILLGSSVTYFLPDLMSHDTEIIRELLFVKKHLSNITDVAYSFKMRDRSSSDGEPVLPKILRKIKQKDYKMKEMEDVRFFLLSLLEHVFEDTCVCATTHSLQILFA